MIFKNQVSWLSLSSEYTVCVLTSLAIPDSSLLLDLLYFYFSCTLWLAWSWYHHVCLFYVASMHKIVNRMSKRINSNVYVNIYNHRLSGDHCCFVSCCNLLVRWLECLHIEMRDRCLIPHSLVNPIAKECQADFHISRFLWKLTQLPHQCIMDRLSEKFWRFSPAHYCYHWAKNWPIPIFNHFPSLRFGKAHDNLTDIPTDIAGKVLNLHAQNMPSIVPVRQAVLTAKHNVPRDSACLHSVDSSLRFLLKLVVNNPCLC